jgi:hypothetical protein
MIWLQAIRLDVYGRLQYRIDAPGRDVLLTGDANAATAALSELGVANPARLIAHVQMWGSINIPDPRSEPPN